ncbi:hypothetical protein BX600DRAFT_530946 [Xylariales sp. PMI_506]|nr:hypothetical protein BX600DRAFT_530946 [Xylariales sp. PMI_506]
MEWVNPGCGLDKKDIRRFNFDSNNYEPIETITLENLDDGKINITHIPHDSETKYRAWVDETCSLSETPKQPGIYLVMFPRLKERKSLALPCSEETFQKTWKHMFQHRSLSQAIKIFNCRSDTESPTKDEDIVLSVTYFEKPQITFAVIYGCTKTTRQFASGYLAKIRASGQLSHSLLFPVLFAELERKRLFNLLERKRTDLDRKLLDMETKLKDHSHDREKEIRRSTEMADFKNCESTKLWIAVSSLKNGLESLKAQLGILSDLSVTLPSCPSRLQGNISNAEDPQKYNIGDAIQIRLREMIAEFDSKIRTYDTLLEGMKLATQLERNYYARQDAKATMDIAKATMADARVNMSIAQATHLDGSQMKTISSLGMFFLPATLVAAVFSMQVFNWMPPDSDYIVSPWFGLYVGVSLILTIVTVWRWRKWSAEEEMKVKEEMKKIMNDDYSIHSSV